MILAAGSLVLAGLGLFVGGLATGTTGYYWGCVACCGSALLLIAVRLLRGSRGAAATDGDTATGRAEPAATGVRGPARGTDADSAAAGRYSRPGARGAPGSATTTGEVPSGTRAGPGGTPGEEDVEVTDLLLVVDLRDQVLVVDDHPRYHLPGCAWLRGRASTPLPVAEARRNGVTPCAVCSPDSRLADLVRARRAAQRK